MPAQLLLQAKAMLQERSIRRNHLSPSLVVLFGLTVATLIAWCAVEPPGWDVVVYRGAMRAVAAGQDPYLDAMAYQRDPRDAGPSFAGQAVVPRFGFIYSPVTLPFLKLADRAPT